MNNIPLRSRSTTKLAPEKIEMRLIVIEAEREESSPSYEKK